MARLGVFVVCILGMVAPLMGAHIPRNLREKRQANGACSQADIVFVLDSSGSVKEDGWNRTLDFVKKVVSQLNVGPYLTRIGLVNYANRATPEFYLDTYNNTEALLAAIDDIKWKDQETNTSGAFWLTREVMFSSAHGDRRRAPNVAIVITDGASNRDRNKTIPYAKEAKDAGIIVFAIGVGDAVNKTELNGIAFNSSYVYEVTNFNALDEIRKQVVMSACDVPVSCQEIGDVAFMLDSSGSVREENFNRMKEAVKVIIDNINVGRNQNSHVGLMTFSDSATIRFPLATHDNREDLKKAVDGVPYTHGTTNTAAALKLARTQLFRGQYDRVNIKNVLLVFTDGGSNNFDETVKEARLTREAGIEIIVIAITDWVNQVEINEMATDPDSQNVFNVKEFSQVTGISKDIKRILCNENDECASNPCQNGGSCIEKTNSYLCRCPDGYAGLHCDKVCRGKADFVLALDSSTSVGRENFYTMLGFTKDLARALNLDNGNVRIGLETFATDVDVKFHLNKFKQTTEVVNAISFPYRRGTTGTHKAIRSIRTEMLTSPNGARPDARKVALVVTDGKSVDRIATFREAVEAHSQGISLMAVGIKMNDYYGELELKGIASDPDDKNMMRVNDFKDLYNLTDNIVDAVCDAVDECEPSPCEAGGTCVNKMNGYECLCPDGRTGMHCEKACDGRSDVIFVVDASGSIRENRFKLLMDYVRNVTSYLEVGWDKTRVGLITFSDSAEVQFHLNRYRTKEDIMQALNYVPYTRGRTNTAAALRMMRMSMLTENNGDRRDVPNFIVVITDGQSNINSQDTIPEAIQARMAGTHIIAVSMGENKRRLEIKGIASDPDSYNIYELRQYSQLPNVVADLVGKMCNDVNECEPNPCENGGRCIDGMGEYECQCSDQYTGANCERRCTRRLDVAFVLDASGSVETHFDLSMRLTKKIVQGLNFKGGRTRVGLLTYSDRAKMRFGLNVYSDRQSVLNAIAYTQDMGRTNTADGLNMMSSNIFVPVNGDRIGDPNYAIVITDGRSNIGRFDTIPAADEARRSGAKIIAVGIGHNGEVDRDEINQIANDPDSQHAFVFENEAELDRVANSILDTLCQ